MSVIENSPAAVSATSPVREALFTARETLDLRAAFVVEPEADGMRCLVFVGPPVAGIAEGQPLPADFHGQVAKDRLPLVTAGGQAIGDLRWIRAPGAQSLTEAERRSLAFFAQVIADRAGNFMAGPGELGEASQTRTTVAGVMAVVASLAGRGVYSTDEAERSIQLAEQTAGALGLPPEGVADVSKAAAVHDIGKLGVPAKILLKRAPLTPREAKALHEHPRLGAQIVESIPELASLAPVVRASRERFDGRGYPDGLAGESIPLGSRIIHVCDAYVAMVSDRPYRAAVTPQMTRSVIARNSGHQFCPRATEALLSVLQAKAVAPAEAQRRYFTPDSARKKAVAPGAVSPGDRTREAWLAKRTPTSTARTTYALATAAGLVFGLLLALPIDSAEKTWLYELTIIFLALAGTLLLTHFLVFVVPAPYRRWRADD